MEKGKNREKPEGAMEIDFFRSRRILQEKNNIIIFPAAIHTNIRKGGDQS